MTKFIYNFKKLLLVYFWPNFPYFWSKKSFFLQNLLLCHAQLQKGFQIRAKIQRILMIQFQENTQRDGRTEGQTQTDPFHRIFPATARGLTSTTAIDWHFKLFLKHATSQNHPQPPKTIHNHPKPAKTTHNHPKPAKTTNNQNFTNQWQKSIFFFLSDFTVPRKQSFQLSEVLLLRYF